MPNRCIKQRDDQFSNCKQIVSGLGGKFEWDRPFISDKMVYLSLETDLQISFLGQLPAIGQPMQCLPFFFSLYMYRQAAVRLTARMRIIMIFANNEFINRVYIPMQSFYCYS